MIIVPVIDGVSLVSITLFDESQGAMLQETAESRAVAIWSLNVRSMSIAWAVREGILNGSDIQISDKIDDNY
jgi:hypothetical protein